MDFWQDLAEDFNEMVERLRTERGANSFDEDHEPVLSMK
jgi:hypothetical protein